jgi:isopentenyl-diphosphate delta-isomerase
MMRPEQVVLVDGHDRAIGTAEKLFAHRCGLLHRAFSAFVFDAAGRMLLQRRALSKYHSPGLWSNTVCSHPGPGEPTDAAASRRLVEELGFACPLEPAFAFTYRVELEPGLWEHEYDHVFIGQWDGAPRPDPAEVLDWSLIEPARIRRELAARPDRFTYWFRIAFAELDRRGLLPPHRELVRDRIA